MFATPIAAPAAQGGLTSRTTAKDSTNRAGRHAVDHEQRDDRGERQTWQVERGGERGERHCRGGDGRQPPPAQPVAQPAAERRTDRPADHQSRRRPAPPPAGRCRTAGSGRGRPHRAPKASIGRRQLRRRTGRRHRSGDLARACRSPLRKAAPDGAVGVRRPFRAGRHGPVAHAPAIPGPPAWPPAPRAREGPSASRPHSNHERQAAPDRRSPRPCPLARVSPLSWRSGSAETRPPRRSGSRPRRSRRRRRSVARPT